MKLRETVYSVLLAGILSAPAYAAGFIPAASLNTARYDHSATLLPDGRVLVTGGDGASTTTATCEIYNPVLDVWSPAAPMSAPRLWHTASLLDDGRVLVVGGYNFSNGTDAAAEIYNPSTDTWTPTAPMRVNRDSHAAAVLSDGRVVVTGGVAPNGDGSSHSTTTTEVYMPSTNTWVQAGPIGNERSGATATVLNNGKVVLVGGYANTPSGSVSAVELFDPVTLTWSPIAPLRTPRRGHSATLLNDGRVMVAGGLYNNGDYIYLSDTEFLDPETFTWSPGPSMTTPKSSHSATLLPDGRVVIIGGVSGFDVNGFGGRLSIAEEFDPIDLAFSVTGVMSTVRHQHTATRLPNGKILVAAGSSGPTLNSAELYDSTPDAGAPRITTPLNAKISLQQPMPAIPLTAISRTPVTFTVSNLPPGFSRIGNAIEGTPTELGMTNVTLTATNANGSDTKTLVVTVVAQAPQITSALTVSTKQSRPFQYTITADGSAPITFSASPLPAGLSFSGQFIYGVPAQPGVTDVTLTAQNGVPPDDVRILRLTVSENTAAPLFTSLPTATPDPAVIGTPVTFIAAAVGADADNMSYSWDFGDGSYGTGATATHVYTVPGIYEVVASVEDSVHFDYRRFNLLVNADTPPGDPELFKINRLTIDFDLKRPGHDSMLLHGQLPFGGVINPRGKRVKLNMSSFNRQFTIQHNGMTPDGAFRFGGYYQQGKYVTYSDFTVRLSRQNILNSLFLLGFSNSGENRQIFVPVIFTYDGSGYVDYPQVLFTISKNKKHAAAKLK